ncbi:DNA-3-methyladenine glycosylase I [Colwellia hornerae]|uniref:DNA-3-methyladenine glycosylase I n=1 Tax=Colwellia hornerae TaxID=89402 RepID=A0A5C6Q3L4_9GAMM|nr:DNA-3-methyladenine glycosylase I [Colwellia hornerae]TWX47405.1 DNA-3-methyladenine glycosylase I [Colwellia hornerae]TWX54685.1 DNA-3-methyladenine glycosylase I [Colwellia hornerae]TWX63398.1 DNA-3-methyladenine glycosylase I [Colwellia hornerae]
MEKFDSLYQRAAERKGGAAILNLLLGDNQQDHLVAKLGDDRILSAFSKKIFQSGFVWRVVENKWPNFEEMFFNFDLAKVLMMPEEMQERKAADARIIRNFNKVKTIQANAHMMFDEIHSDNSQHDSFAKFIAAWPSNDMIGLWDYLKKKGQRLGGNTGPYALRAIGKDTFLLTRDIEAYFRANKIIDGGIQSKKSLLAIQNTFNQWQNESDLSLTQLSRLVAFATGDNHIQVEFD